MHVAADVGTGLDADDAARVDVAFEPRLGLAGIERAVIYGSWARRYQGEAGPLPQDVDLLVIGAPAVGEVRAAADAAYRPSAAT